jgi:hypothetical protein
LSQQSTIALAGNFGGVEISNMQFLSTNVTRTADLGRICYLIIVDSVSKAALKSLGGQGCIPKGWLIAEMDRAKGTPYPLSQAKSYKV